MAFDSGTLTAWGLRPKRDKTGKTNFAVNLYVATDATAIGLYEPVSTTGTADANGFPIIKRNVAGAAIRGVAVGFMQYTPGHKAASLAANSGYTQYHYRPASTTMYVLVMDDPNAIFEVQEDGDTTPIAITSVGLNCDLATAADCNTTTGLSTAKLDSNTVNTTATLQCKILGLTEMVDGSNVIGDSYNCWDVMINSHELGQGTGSTGI